MAINRYHACVELPGDAPGCSPPRQARRQPSSPEQPHERTGRSARCEADHPHAASAPAAAIDSGVAASGCLLLRDVGFALRTRMEGSGDVPVPSRSSPAFTVSNAGLLARLVSCSTASPPCCISCIRTQCAAHHPGRVPRESAADGFAFTVGGSLADGSEMPKCEAGAIIGKAGMGVACPAGQSGNWQRGTHNTTHTKQMH